MTSEATPQKPTLTPVTMNLPPIFSVFHGGVAGYGRTQVDATSAFPAARQQIESTGYAVTGAGLGVFRRSMAPDEFAGPAKGDSGGPLYRYNPGSAARDVIGVSSGYNDTSCDLELWPFCTETHNSYWCDITYPPTAAWIRSQVDPDGDGRWEGELDYAPRTDYAAPLACSAQDPDCDGIENAHDNCPHDWNPDQYNSDEPTSDDQGQFLDPKYDPPTKLDPGDACDSCYLVPGPQSDCNLDAEVLAAGSARPHLTEADVVGIATNPEPNPSSKLKQNRARYAGDACDAALCTETASKGVGLDPAVYGSPPNGCTKTPCQYGAPAQIDRDPLGVPVAPPSTGQTGYAFCQCGGPFASQADRLSRCLAGPTAPCRWGANDFPAAHPLSSPAFVSIGGSALGTIDTFKASPGIPQSFSWDFVADYNALAGATVSLPLTPAEVMQVRLKGLIWSNVRTFVGANGKDLNAAAGRRDLASYWLPMDLRVTVPSWIPLPPKSSPLPGGWYSCSQNCPWGLLKPYLWIVDPGPDRPTPQLVAGTAGGPVDITEQLGDDASLLLRDQSAAPRFIGASEPASLLLARDLAAPVLAAFDDASSSVVGALTQGADGRLHAVGGSVLCSPEGCHSRGMPQSVDRGSMPTALALSAVHSTLYRLAPRPTTSGFELQAYRLDTAESTTISLAPPLAFNNPVALTYSWADDCLYAIDVDRLGLVRLLRVNLDGSTRLVAIAPRFGANAWYLTAAADGSLLVGVSRARLSGYSLFRVEPRPHGLARIRLVAHGRAPLAAAPFADGRALYVAFSAAEGALDVQALPWRPTVDGGATDDTWTCK